MRYQRVHLGAIGYELAPVVVSTAELEQRLEPLYKSLHIPIGQLEHLTGIRERRWWEEGFPVSRGASLAAKKALDLAGLDASEIDAVIYAGVCREQFEPATACQVAHEIGIGPDALMYDLSNACLGVLNGVVEIANRIELGQCRAGLVVSCESSRDINEAVIDQMLMTRSMDLFKKGLATLTGGSGAVAVLVVDEKLAQGRRQLLGGATKAAPEHHGLCRWGLEGFLPALQRLMPATYGRVIAPALEVGQLAIDRVQPRVERMLHKTDAGAMVRQWFEMGLKHCVVPFMHTDAVAVLKHGVDLGMKTFKAFLTKLEWAADQMNKVICHQVGTGHRDAILKSLSLDGRKDFSTYPYLGNMGTVSLPLTAAIAEERGHLNAGDRVGFMGIGSGLNCMMLGLRW